MRMYKKRLLLFLPFGVVISAFVALFEFELYQYKVLREALAMVMDIGWVGFILLRRALFYPGKKIKVGLTPGFTRFLAYMALAWSSFSMCTCYQLLVERSLFSLLLLLYFLMIIIIPFLRYDE